MNEIRGFFPPYDFLSNFHIRPFYYGNRSWLSGEHMYQASKTLSLNEQEWIRSAPTPNIAKSRGRELDRSGRTRKDWHEDPNDETPCKIRIMRKVARAKYEDKKLCSLLIATDPLELFEENYWGDLYWGTVKGKGRNELGKIIMTERTYRIQQEKL